MDRETAQLLMHNLAINLSNRACTDPYRSLIEQRQMLNSELPLKNKPPNPLSASCPNVNNTVTEQKSKGTIKLNQSVEHLSTVKQEPVVVKTEIE